MRKMAILIATVALGGLLAASSPVQANALSYIFTTIDVPGSLPGTTGNFGLGINDAGQIVEDFTDSAGTFGFLDAGGKFTTINPPGATFTILFGINNLGQILGTSSSTRHIYYHRAGVRFRHQRFGPDRRAGLRQRRLPRLSRNGQQRYDL